MKLVLEIHLENLVDKISAERQIFSSFFIGEQRFIQNLFKREFSYNKKFWPVLSFEIE